MAEGGRSPASRALRARCDFEFYRRAGLVSSGPRALPAGLAAAQSEWKSLEQGRGVLQGAIFHEGLRSPLALLTGMLSC